MAWNQGPPDSSLCCAKKADFGQECLQILNGMGCLAAVLKMTAGPLKLSAKDQQFSAIAQRKQ